MFIIFREKAKKIFTVCMQHDPDHKKCQKTLKKARKTEELKEQGNNHFKEGSLEKAIECYTEAISIDKANKIMNSILYANRALVYSKKDKNENAIEDCNQAILHNDANVKAYLRRADLKIKIKEYDQAIADYKKVKEIDSSQNVNNLIANA